MLMTLGMVGVWWYNWWLRRYYKLDCSKDVTTGLTTPKSTSNLSVNNRVLLQPRSLNIEPDFPDSPLPWRQLVGKSNFIARDLWFIFNLLLNPLPRGHGVIDWNRERSSCRSWTQPSVPYYWYCHLSWKIVRLLSRDGVPEQTGESAAPGYWLIPCQVLRLFIVLTNT